MAKRGPKNPLTDAHKAAMAEGRRDANAVKAYLGALRSTAQSQRRRSPDELRSSLAEVESRLAEVDDPIAEIKLLQQRRDLRRELARMTSEKDLKALEKEFVKVASRYSSRNGIDFETWQEAGVSESTLTRAGLTPTG